MQDCCRQYALPSEVLDDIVDEAGARLPADADLGERVAVVDELVRVEADRCGRRCVALLEPGAGVPPLLPAFLGVSSLHARPRHLHRALGSAAVAVAVLALDYERFFLFYLAWIEGKTLAEMLAMFEERARARRHDRLPHEVRALQRRLRRTSDTIERELRERLDAWMGDRERVWLRAVVGAPDRRRKLASAIPPPEAASWSVLMRALEAAVHTSAASRTRRPHSDAGAGVPL